MGLLACVSAPPSTPPRAPVVELTVSKPTAVSPDGPTPADESQADGGASRRAERVVVAQNEAGWDDGASPVPVSSHDPWWGDRAAPVTIVAFSDFQCPFCKRAATTIDALERTYGPSKLRVVWKHTPLVHPGAKPAHAAAQVVHMVQGRDAFWRFHDRVFADPKMSAQQLEAAAVGLGVPPRRYRQLLPAAAAKVAQDAALGARLRVTGTPSFLINGVRLTGAQPPAKFETIIDAQLTFARGLLRRGVAHDGIYVAASRANFKPAPPKPTPPPTVPQGPVFVAAQPWSPRRGPLHAKVTVVVFTDFQCPFCAKVEPVLKDVFDAYGGRVGVHVRHLPLSFHTHAEQAARAVQAAKRQNKHWQMHDMLFQNQRALDVPDLERYARTIGLNVGRWKRDFESAAVKREVEADVAAATAAGVRGTPTIFINGAKHQGARTLASFQAVIDPELRRADALLRAGVPMAELHRRLSLSNTATLAPPPVVPPGPRLSAKHILIQYDGAERSNHTRSKSEARAQAQDLVRRLRAGADFDSLVQAFSDEPGSAARNGNLGTFRKGQMVAPFEAAVERLKIGEVSGVVETAFGFHIIVRLAPSP